RLQRVTPVGIIVNITGMPDVVERVLSFQVTIVELACAGLLLAGPYLAVGIVWACTHSAHFDQLQGVQLAGSVLGSIALWPALGVAGPCVT
ncbi:MAG: hypothetical protein ACRDTV_04580, partial [Mycobacterium sp.]